MSVPPLSIPDSTSVGDAHSLMARHRIRCLPVKRDGRVAGIVTDRDIRTARGFAPSLGSATTDVDAQPVGGLLAPDLFVAHPDDSIEEVARGLRDHKIGGVPVLDAQQALVGVLTVTDLLAALIRALNGGDGRRLTVPLGDGSPGLSAHLRDLEERGIEVRSVVTFRGPDGRPVQAVLRVRGGDPAGPADADLPDSP